MLDSQTNSRRFNPTNLGARLMLMGAVAPVSPEKIDYDWLENAVAGLPPIYECRYGVQDHNGTALVIEQYDMSPENLNRRVLNSLRKHDLRALPDKRTVSDSTPEAWWGFLNQDVRSMNLDDISDKFKAWGIELTPEQITSGFDFDPFENIKDANELLRHRQQDLISRLIRMGVVQPIDPETAAPQQLDDIVKGLPALTESEVIVQAENGGIERKRFINIAEYYLKEVAANQSNMSLDYTDFDMNENEFSGAYSGIENNPETKGAKKKIVNSVGDYSLRLQKEKYLLSKGFTDEQIIHSRQGISGGYAWLDYFNQGLSEADPAGRQENGKYSLKALKQAFRNWELDFKATNLEAGFEKDFELNLREAKIIYAKALISKVVNAGIVPGLPKDEWRSLNQEKADLFIDKIPLLPEQSGPGDWLELFRGTIPSAIDLARLQNSFIDAGINYDEKLILASFKQPPKSKIEGIRKMEQIELSKYQEMVKRLRNMGKIEISNQEISELNLEMARDYVRAYDDPATDKQKVLIGSMNDEGRLQLSDAELGGLMKMEANHLIDNAPKMAIPTEAPTNPITEATKKELKRLTDNGMMAYIPPPIYKNLSEEGARKKIDSALSRQPASENQKNFIKDAMKKGTITVEMLAKHINAPNIGNQEINALNMLQARSIIENMPASEKQIETIKQLVEDKRIEPPESYTMTLREASRILDDAFSKKGELDPEGPATTRQLDAIRKMVENKEIAAMGPEQINVLKYAEAGKILDKAPATPAQKSMYSRLVKEGKLDSIPGPTFNVLTRAEASNHINVGIGKLDRSQMIELKIIDYPASDSQMKALNELKEKGKIAEIPPELTSKEASKMISNAISGDPLSPQQLGILEKKIANNQLPPMDEETKAKLTQGEFSELLKQAAKAPEKSQEKAPEPSAEKNRKKGRTPAGVDL